MIVGVLLFAYSVKGASYSISDSGFLASGDFDYIGNFAFETGDKSIGILKPLMIHST